jgi:hypothetical protein
MFAKRLVATIAAAGAVALIAGSALAGSIILRSEVPSVCEVEVAVGPGAPNAPIQKFGDLTLPWEQIFDTDKLCVRYSEPPEQCGSWTDWHCCESSGAESLCVID